MNIHAGSYGKWTQSKVAAVERGPDPQRAGRAVRVDELVLFAQALNVGIDELMSGKLSEQTRERLVREQAVDEAFTRIQAALITISEQVDALDDLQIEPSDLLAPNRLRYPSIDRWSQPGALRLDLWAEQAASKLKKIYAALDETTP